MKKYMWKQCYKAIPMNCNYIGLSFAIFIFLMPISGKSQSEKSILIDNMVLERNLKKIQGQDVQLSKALSRVLIDANRRLNISGYSVIDKNLTPKNGTKHDFLSFARYYWYDSTADRLTRIDGKTNNRIEQIQDQDAMNALCKDISVLGLAYYYSKNEKYAAQASKLLKRWFLDSSTKMNPNMEYSQVTSLNGKGRSTGIVSAYGLISLIDGVLLLNGAKSWTSSDNDKLKQWFSQFLDWMIKSELGKKASLAKNNIGSYYDAQVMAYSLYTNNINQARVILKKVKLRIGYQFNKDGYQPFEVNRASSYKYSIFNLEAYIILARLSKNLGDDLLKYMPPAGAGIIKGLQVLHPYSFNEKKWPYIQSEKISPQRYIRMLRIVKDDIKVSPDLIVFNYNLLDDCIQKLTL